MGDRTNPRHLLGRRIGCRGWQLLGAEGGSYISQAYSGYGMLDKQTGAEAQGEQATSNSCKITQTEVGPSVLPAAAWQWIIAGTPTLLPLHLPSAVFMICLCNINIKVQCTSTPMVSVHMLYYFQRTCQSAFAPRKLADASALCLGPTRTN